MTMTSRPGHGTRFTVNLPLACPTTLPSVAADDPIADRPLAHRIVLLAENDADLRGAISMTLENWGADVLACASASEAVALLREIDIAPDVVLADYQLEDGATGATLIADLRALYGPLPAVIITANRAAAPATEAAALNVPLLYKPLDLDALRSTLESA